MRRLVLLVPWLLLGAIVGACGSGQSAGLPAAPQSGATPGEPDFRVSSAAFVSGESIPAQYTCQGDDISPPVQWANPPSGTQAFVLFMDDPDGGNWVHWSLYDLPASSTGVPEALPPDAELPDGSRQGQNSWGTPGYGGPCPPSGTHRYVFTLYALDAPLGLTAGVKKGALFEAMEGHVLAQAQIVGLYSKR